MLGLGNTILAKPLEYVKCLFDFFVRTKVSIFFALFVEEQKAFFDLKLYGKRILKNRPKKAKKKRGASKRSRTPFFFLFGFFFARSIFYLKFRFLSNFVQFVELCRIVSYFALF